jgi:hypothetical protein
MRSATSHRTTGNTSSSTTAINTIRSDEDLIRFGAYRLSTAESRMYAHLFPKRAPFFVRLWRFITNRG